MEAEGACAHIRSIDEIAHAKRRECGGGKKVARALVCWPFCGSGDKFNGTITVTNRDDVIVFAYLARKGNIKKAASDAAKKVRDHIEGKS